ncbi:MAG: hypothetical protein RTU63_08255 [Candidatus Thorarchaeota archaeon]
MPHDDKNNDDKGTDLRNFILSDYPHKGLDETKRFVTVMTRLHGEYVELVDALVKLKIFRSRSEALATLVMKTLLADLETFQDLKEQADRMDDVQDTVRDLAIKVLRK